MTLTTPAQAHGARAPDCLSTPRLPAELLWQILKFALAAEKHDHNQLPACAATLRLVHPDFQSAVDRLCPSLRWRSLQKLSCLVGEKQMAQPAHTLPLSSADVVHMRRLIEASASCTDARVLALPSPLIWETQPPHPLRSWVRTSVQSVGRAAGLLVGSLGYGQRLSVLRELLENSQATSEFIVQLPDHRRLCMERSQRLMTTLDMARHSPYAIRYSETAAGERFRMLPFWTQSLFALPRSTWLRRLDIAAIPLRMTSQTEALAYVLGIEGLQELSLTLLETPTLSEQRAKSVLSPLAQRTDLTRLHVKLSLQYHAISPEPTPLYRALGACIARMPALEYLGIQLCSFLTHPVDTGRGHIHALFSRIQTPTLCYVSLRNNELRHSAIEALAQWPRFGDTVKYVDLSGTATQERVAYQLFRQLRARQASLAEILLHDTDKSELNLASMVQPPSRIGLSTHSAHEPHQDLLPVVAAAQGVVRDRISVRSHWRHRRQLMPAKEVCYTQDPPQVCFRGSGEQIQWRHW